jgi:hypothetical protein
MTELQSVIANFTAQITALVDAQATEQARSVVFAALGADGHAPKRRGRPPKALAAAPALAKKVRKKAPVQLCPVPGCKNPAAPIFGMVCAKHKDLPKTKIKQFREARKAKKLGLKPPKAARRKAKKVGAKKAPASKTRKAPKVAAASKVSSAQPASASATA